MKEFQLNTILEDDHHETDKSLILLCENDEMMVKLLSHKLKEELDCEVMIARNGNQAFNILGEHAVDLVITELYLPYKTGLEIIERTREISTEIPVIIYSNDLTQEILEKSIQLGVDDFLKKPFMLYQMMMRIKMHVMTNHY